jgi:hypothetical protein
LGAKPMKKLNLFTLFILLLATFYSHAQAPTKVWDKTIGGGVDDLANSIVATSDGGFVIAGYSFSGISGDKTEASQGIYDFWVVKLNSSGQKVWDKTLGGTFNDVANSIVATTDGGFVIAGYSYSGMTGDKTEPNKGGNDFWVVKLNSLGQKVWDKTLGGIGNESANSIVATADGGFVVAGISDFGMSLDRTEASQGSSDYWIVKINSLGQKVWDKSIGGISADNANSIVATIDGGFVIAGESQSGISGDKTETVNGNNDYWMVKLNGLGQKIWEKTIGGGSNDIPYSIVASSDGGFVVAGHSYSGISFDKTEANKGVFDYWIVKLNSIGQKVWDKTIGGNNAEIATSIVATSDGGFVMAGRSISDISGDKTQANIGDNDYWIVKLNSLGQKVWDKTIGGGSTDVPASIALTSDGGFVVAGYSFSGIYADKTEASRGSLDYWVIRLSGPPCPNTLTPTGLITTNQKAATTVITLAGTMAGGTLNTIPNAANVTYQGGNHVQLNPGFIANSGSVFLAKILAGCL